MTPMEIPRYVFRTLHSTPVRDQDAWSCLPNLTSAKLFVSGGRDAVDFGHVSAIIRQLLVVWESV